ncbi:hypothetical protein N7501_005037 [Penicillium viridicatum]|nr:hypothetical protein N7501_005037 [Penicillium viridicatum]
MFMLGSHPDQLALDIEAHWTAIASSRGIMGSYEYIMPLSFAIQCLRNSHKGQKLVSTTEPSHGDRLV